MAYVAVGALPVSAVAVSAREVLWNFLSRMRSLPISWGSYTFRASDQPSSQPVLLPASADFPAAIQWGPFTERYAAQTAWKNAMVYLGSPDRKFPLSGSTTLSQAVAEIATVVSALPASMPGEAFLPAWAKWTLGALGVAVIGSFALGRKFRGKISTRKRRRTRRRRTYRRRR